MAAKNFLNFTSKKYFPVAARIFFQTHFFPLLKLKNKAEEIYLGIRSKTGETIPVLVNAARRTTNGEIFNDCVFVAMRQRNQYEDEILKAKKEAEAATIAKDEFLIDRFSRIAHAAQRDSRLGANTAKRSNEC